MILNKGEISYFGEARLSVPYYKNLGFESRKDQNPIDYFIDIAIKGSPETDKMFFDYHKKNYEP